MLSAVIPSEHSYPAMRLASQPVHQRYVHSGPLVLGAGPLKYPTPTADRDQTVSRRFKPSSRTTLNGEQPYPWDRLQPQDVMSRHRGAKLRRRCELLGGISLLSPETKFTEVTQYIGDPKLIPTGWKLLRESGKAFNEQLSDNS